MPRPSRSHPSRKPGSRHRPGLHLELLESRRLLTTFVVSNTKDSGMGSLRAAITQVNSGPTDTNENPPDLIDFDIKKSDSGYNDVTKIWTITLTSAHADHHQSRKHRRHISAVLFRHAGHRLERRRSLRRRARPGDGRYD